jgi:uncharacterized protein
MKKILCIVFLVFLLSVNIGFAQEIPTMTKYVNDFANVLSTAEEDRINSLCADIENNWTVEIAVLTVQTTQPMTIEEYAVNVFEKNGIGKKDKDNGLLIVAAIDDRKWRFEVGYGLEPVIPDAKAGRVGEAYLIPYFKEGKYGDGLYYSVDAINKILQNSGDDSFISDQIMSDEEIFNIIIMLIIFAVLILPFILILIFNFTAERCPKCGARMKCHYEGEYLICECPKCGKKTKKKKRTNFWFFVGGIGHGGFGGSGGGGFGGGGSGGGGAGGSW